MSRRARHYRARGASQPRAAALQHARPRRGRRPRPLDGGAGADPRCSWRSRWRPASSRTRWRCSPTPGTCSPTPAAIAFSLVALRLAARPARRGDDVRLQARGDPLRAGQRRDAADPRRVHRLRGDPPAVRAAATSAAAWCWRWRSSASLVNLAAVWTLSGANRGSLNVEGSFQHLLTDLYGFIGTAIAAA